MLGRSVRYFYNINHRNSYRCTSLQQRINVYFPRIIKFQNPMWGGEGEWQGTLDLKFILPPPHKEIVKTRQIIQKCLQNISYNRTGGCRKGMSHTFGQNHFFPILEPTSHTFGQNHFFSILRPTSHTFGQNHFHISASTP